MIDGEDRHTRPDDTSGLALERLPEGVKTEDGCQNGNHAAVQIQGLLMTEGYNRSDFHPSWTAPLVAMLSPVRLTSDAG